MLPRSGDLDREVSEAEAEVSRADAQVRASYGTLKQRFLDRLPWLVGAGIGVAIFLLLPRSRRGVPATRGLIGRSPWSRLAAPLVNLLISRGVGLLTAVFAAMIARKPAKPLAAVPHVDLDRYAGMWFEIARMPTRAEDRCERDVTATYAVTDSGLSVINRCRRADGRIQDAAVGRARVVEDRTNARLQVSFAPTFLDALPFVWGDYWILDLADDYDAAMVGTPDRKHLWLLSRTPRLPGTELSAFIARANQQGFDTARLLYTEQTVRQAPPAPGRQTNGEGLLSAHAPRETGAESRAG